jgi:hypothetical protein
MEGYGICVFKGAEGGLRNAAVASGKISVGFPTRASEKGRKP